MRRVGCFIAVAAISGCNAIDHHTQFSKADSGPMEQNIVSCQTPTAKKYISLQNTPTRPPRDYKIVSTESLLTRLDEASSAWQTVNQSIDGNYSYIRHFQSWTGANFQTQVDVKNNIVKKKTTTTMAVDPGAADNVETVTAPEALASNDNGYPGLTYEQLVNQCRADIQALSQTNAPAQFNLCLDQDIIVSCLPVDLRIADDQPLGFTFSRLSY